METIFARIWENLIGRIGGPLSFRLIHPADGRRLVCASRRVAVMPEQGRVPYGWDVITNPVNRRDLLRQGWKDIAKVFVAAMLDRSCLSNHRASDGCHPEEALIVATNVGALAIHSA